MRLLSLILITLTLAGCATDDYTKYTAMHTQIEGARAQAEAEKYKALSKIAEAGDETSRVAAVIALMSSHKSPTTAIAAPKSGWDSAREWASVIVPAAASAFGFYIAGDVAKNSSDNARLTSISTNDAFVGVAGKIQSPAANVTTTTTNDNHSVTDRHDVVNNPTEVVQLPAAQVVQIHTKICTTAADGTVSCH